MINFYVEDMELAPEKGTEGAAGFDLRANISTSFILRPGERKLIPTGVKMEMDKGSVGFICSRSGLSLKYGVIVLNAPGVIDSDYRGEVGVILYNSGSEVFTIHPKDRIAQLVVTPVQLGWVSVSKDGEQISATNRGDGGFGSTGTK